MSDPWMILSVTLATYTCISAIIEQQIESLWLETNDTG